MTDGDRPFARSQALVVGINDYRGGIPELLNARRDAQALGRLLERRHAYRVSRLTRNVTRRRLLEAVDRLGDAVEPEDRALFYFAGHGIAPEDELGITGYLLPEDASKVVDAAGLLSMDLLKEKLQGFACRHLLVILDCCYAGAFRWASTRHGDLLPQTVHSEHYLRYVRDPAWQVLTSSSHDQRVLDAYSRLGRRGSGEHSPFARALLDGLGGEADWLPPGGDGLITAGELAEYLRHRVELETLEAGRRQTPGLFHLERHDKGQYVFEVPGREMDLQPAPDLTREANPYRGLRPFEAAHEDLFFGRDELVKQLRAHVGGGRLSVVAGASGTGKSSLVRAGLVPLLARGSDWQLVGPLRPTARPLQALASGLRRAGLGRRPATASPAAADLVGSLAEHPAPLLLIVDQLEELVTLAEEEAQGLAFLEILNRILALEREDLRILVTIRSDFEPHFTSVDSVLGSMWPGGRLAVPPFTHDQLRQVILGPASRRVLFFEDGLVERLVEEVVLEPGGLPLLSFTLRQLYEGYLGGERTDRCLTHEDLDRLGGVAGAVRERAEHELERLGEEDPAAQATLRRLMLRMVALRGGEPTRRQVPMDELESRDAAENARIESVLERLESARLVVPDVEPDGSPFVEPAHDQLIKAWPRLRVWLDAGNVDLPLQRWIAATSRHWHLGQRPANLLTPDDPRILQLLAVARGPESWLSARELDFMQASHRAKVAAEKQRQRRRRATWGSVVAVLAAALVAALGWIDLQQRNAAQNLALVGRGLMDTANQLQKGLQVATSSLVARPGALATLAVIRGNRSLLPELSGFRHGGATEVSEAAFTAGGRWVATGGYSGRLQLTDLATGTPVAMLDLDSRIRGLDVHPTGRKIAVASHTGLELIAVETRDAAVTLRRIATAPFEEWAYAVKFVAEGEDLVVGGAGGMLRRFAVAGAEEASWQPTVVANTGHGIFKLAITPAGDVLAAGTHGLAKLFASTTFEKKLELELGDRRSVSALAVSPGGSVAATGDFLGRVRLWDLGRGQILRQTSLDALVHALAFSSDGRLIAAGGQDRTARVWRVDSLDPAGTVVHESFVKTLAFSPARPDRLLTTGSDGWVRTWDLAAGAEHVRAAGSDLAVTPSGSLLAIGAGDGVKILSPDAGEELAAIQAGRDVWHLRWGPEGSRLLAWQLSRVDVFEITARGDSPARVRTLAHENAAGKVGVVSALVPGPGRQHVVTGTRLGSVRVWNLETGGAVELPGHDGWVHGLAADEQTGSVVTAGGDGEVRVWDLASRREIGRVMLAEKVVTAAFARNRFFAQQASTDKACLCSFPAGAAGGRVVTDPDAAPFHRLEQIEPAGPCPTAGNLVCRALALGPDGRRLASFSPTGAVFALAFSHAFEDNPVELRDGRSGEVVARLDHGDALNDLAFSSDGALLATACLDLHARIWRASDGAELARIPHPAEVTKVAWAGTGSRYLATLAEDDQVRLWGWRPADLVRDACARLTLGMDDNERRRIGGVLSLDELCGEAS